MKNNIKMKVTKTIRIIDCSEPFELVEYKNEKGQLHRDGGPAVLSHLNSSGEYNSEYWYQCDLFHREGGPSINHKDINCESWYLNGNRHNENGPAIIFYGKESYWINGENLSENEFRLLKRKKEINKILNK